MTKTNTQNSTAHPLLRDVGVTVQHFVAGMLGRHQLAAEVSTAAAQFDGLIGLIERAGWDIARLEQIRHAFDETAQGLIDELVHSYPEMSEAEQGSFLAPFRTALQQFVGLTGRERVVLRAEYARFREAQARAVASYGAKNSLVNRWLWASIEG